MPKMPTSCPRCRTSIMTEIDQLFDVNIDPKAKQRLLSGSFNMINCPNCGYKGVASTPLVYHDPDKELLLTYFPPELGLPVNEQERLIGPLINQVVNKLAMEKRKAYLFRPQTMLTMQTMIEKVLEKDGITHEMLEAQQKKLMLLQRLLTASPESRAGIIKQEEALIDEDLFNMLNRLVEATSMQGDERTARALAALQDDLLKHSSIGKELEMQSREAEEALKSLQEAGKKGLTREKLLELIVNAPNETRLATLVSLARSGLDYQFFQMLTDRIDHASGDQQKALSDLRDKLLEMTNEIDKVLAEQKKQLRQLLDQILSAPDIEKATEQNIELVNQMFLEELTNQMQDARKKADLDRIGKLQKVVNVIEKASAPPPEVELAQKLVDAPDDATRRQILEQNAEMVNQEFLALINQLIAQSEQQGQPKELLDQLQAAYRSALRFSMEKNLKK
jgi:hypothetical protein